MAIYAISDIHGHYATYKKLLEKLKFSENDFLYVVGDVIEEKVLYLEYGDEKAVLFSQEKNPVLKMNG